MRTNINLIKFSGILSLVFVIITYVISLDNILEYKFAWITKDFALAISSGIFAGFFVMLICEIQKYLKAKEEVERYIFYQTVYLYIQVFLIRKNLNESLENKSKEIHKNLLTEYKNCASNQIYALRQIDYITFGKKNLFTINVSKFLTQELDNLEKFLNYCGCLEIAVLTSQHNNIQSGVFNNIITSSDEIVSKTITKLINLATEKEEEISTQLQLIDDHCKNRFNWEERRKKIKNGYRSLKNCDVFNQLLNEEA